MFGFLIDLVLVQVKGILPLFIFPYVYSVFSLAFSALFLHIYRSYRLKPGEETNFEFWKEARRPVASGWDFFARLWYGYEVVGWENFPKTDEAALLICYHGAVPADINFMYFRTYLETGRQLYAVTDKFTSKIPFLKSFRECFLITSANQEECLDILNKGGALVICPGGTFEAQFSDENYDILWRNRMGFAKVALKANVKVIPIFTENIREAFRQLTVGKSFWLKIYELTKLPMIPIYGGFPVKLRTHIGKPVIPNENDTAEILRDRVTEAMKTLIKENQKLPGNITSALMQRFSK
uniref:Phospholipid/glycerol acyltransferase domain-containing protein n=1 Tax=Megaselia scalaris TaxID=36166 RepID=T1GAJ6_MEGSC